MKAKAEVLNLKIKTKLPVSLKKQGVIQHECGSTHFHFLMSGRVVCHKCREVIDDIFVTDKPSESLAATIS